MTGFPAPVLVIGGNGFIGSHIVERLRSGGAAVRIFARSVTDAGNMLGIETVTGDTRNSGDVSRALEGIDAVIHCASTTFPASSNASFSVDITDNLVSTVHSMELAEAAGVKRFVYISSGGTVYGPTDAVPIDENQPRRPINSYGVVKSTVEQYGELFNRRGRLSFAAIRPSNPYGPRQGHSGTQGAIATFLRRVRDGRAIEIWGDGRVVRDYLHVTDLAELTSRVLASDATGAFNAGSGVGYSLLDILAQVEKTTGRRPQIEFRPGREVDVPVNVLDSSKAQEQFGWKPSIDLSEGMAALWLWLAQNA